MALVAERPEGRQHQEERRRQREPDALADAVG